MGRGKGCVGIFPEPALVDAPIALTIVRRVVVIRKSQPNILIII